GVSLGGFFHRTGAPVVQEWSAYAQAPKRRRANFVRQGRCLRDAVASADVVQQEIREERHGLPVEQRVPGRSRLERRDMAARAARRLKKPLAGARVLVDGSARRRAEKLQEGLELVDCGQSCPRIAHVFRIGRRVALVKPCGGYAVGEVGGENAVSMSH